jgi:hypothetical protein
MQSLIGIKEKVAFRVSGVCLESVISGFSGQRRPFILKKINTRRRVARAGTATG